MSNYLNYVSFYGNVGGQARYLLESTFDVVANSSIVCVRPSGTPLVFKAILHDEVVRARRAHLEVGNEEGIVDVQSKRAILLVRDIIAFGLQRLDAAWYFLVENKNKEFLERYDFSIKEPFQDIDLTPFAGANEVFSVYYLRRSEELESQLPSVVDTTGRFSFNLESA